MNKKCIPINCETKTVVSGHNYADKESEKLLRLSVVGTEIVFADRTILVEEFVPTTLCKKCVFAKERDSTKGPVCNRFNLCSSPYRRDHQSVCFVDEKK